jgi:HEAT repeat protein
MSASKELERTGSPRRPISARLSIQVCRQEATIGSPRRPMPARIAFRRQERGVKLRTDTYIAPTAACSQRLGINTRALPLFPKAPVVVENPREKLVQVLSSLVDVLELHRTITTSSEEGPAEKGSVRRKPPLCLQQFKRPAPFSKPGGARPFDINALEKTILDQSRKLDVHLQDVWNGCVALSEDETLTIQYLIKERIMPALDFRIARLDEIIREMMPECWSDFRETPMQPARDLSSYKQELERRTAARETMTIDLRNITAKALQFKHQKKDLLTSTARQIHFKGCLLRGPPSCTPKKAGGDASGGVDGVEFEGGGRREALELKHKEKVERLLRNTAPQNILFTVPWSPKKADHKKRVVDDLDFDFGGRASVKDAKNGDQLPQIVELMCSSHTKDKISGLEQLCSLDVEEVLKRAPVQDAQRVYANLVDCLLSPHRSLRKSALPLLARKGALFSRVPVQETPPKPEDKHMDPDVHERYAMISADNALLTSIFDCAERSSYEAQVSFLGEIQQVVRIQDEENMKRIFRFLKSPASFVRVSAIKALVKHTLSKNSMQASSARFLGTLQAIAALKTDPEWDVRVAVCSALPNIAQIPAKMQRDQGLEAEERRKMWDITMKVLEELLDDEADNTRRAAIFMFAKVGTPGTRRSVSILLKGCCDHSPLVRAAAFRCLPSIVHRTIDPALETLAHKIEAETTRDWLVEELVAMLAFKQEIRRHALTALFGDEPETRVNPLSEGNTTPIPGIVPKAHLRVLQGLNEHIKKGNTDLQKAILEMLPDVTTSTSENHTLAVLPALHCLTSPSDIVRQTACLVLPKLVAGMDKDSVAVGHLVTLLGAGRENDSSIAPATKRSVMAVLQSISGLQTDDLRAQRGLIMDIAFGLHSSTYEDHKVDPESRMDSITETEARTLDSYPDDVYVAKGVCCRLSTGVSGFSASHWKRYLILLKRDGSLLLTVVRSKDELTCVFHEFSTFTVARTSYGSIVQNAAKIEIMEESTSGITVVIGFFTNDEANVWVRDFKNVIQRNAKRAAAEAVKKQKKVETVKLIEPDFVGRTEKLLHQYVDSLLNPVAESDNSESKAKQRFIQERLSQLFNDKEAFASAVQYTSACKQSLVLALAELAPDASLKQIFDTFAADDGQNKKRAASIDSKEFLPLLEFLNLLPAKINKTQAMEMYAKGKAKSGGDKSEVEWAGFEFAMKKIADLADVSFSLIHTYRVEAKPTTIHKTSIPPKISPPAAFLRKPCHPQSFPADAKHVRPVPKTDETPEENAHLSVKLDIVMFLGLLRANDLYGKTGFTQQAVSHSWKMANAGGDGIFKAVHHSTDKDNLKLDWYEYQTCIRLLAMKAGVSLDIDTELQVNSKVNRAPREAAGALLSEHWSDIHFFLTYCAGTTFGPSKTSSHVIAADWHLKSMDFKEFLVVAQYLKVFPNLIARYQLSEIFRAANRDSVDDQGEGEDVNELNFDEFKSAIIGIASALDLPILCNGRNLASKVTFPLKREVSIASNLK